LELELFKFVNIDAMTAHDGHISDGLPDLGTVQTTVVFK